MYACTLLLTLFLTNKYKIKNCTVRTTVCASIKTIITERKRNMILVYIAIVLAF